MEETPKVINERAIHKVGNEISIEGRTYFLNSPHAQGAFDLVTRDVSTAILHGWAGRDGEHYSNPQVIAIAENKVIGQTECRHPRPDTERILHKNSNRSGFDLPIPIQVYEKEKGNITIYVLFEDMRALELTAG